MKYEPDRTGVILIFSYFLDNDLTISLSGFIFQKPFVALTASFTRVWWNGWKELDGRSIRTGVSYFVQFVYFCSLFKVMVKNTLDSPGEYV